MDRSYEAADACDKIYCHKYIIVYVAIYLYGMRILTLRAYLRILTESLIVNDLTAGVCFLRCILYVINPYIYVEFRRLTGQ